MKRLWLWRNYVDGVPRYVAYDNPFPCHECGDPLTLGVPHGWAQFDDSVNGRPEVDDMQVIHEIQHSIDRKAATANCQKSAPVSDTLDNIG